MILDLQAAVFRSAIRDKKGEPNGSPFLSFCPCIPSFGLQRLTAGISHASLTRNGSIKHRDSFPICMATIKGDIAYETGRILGTRQSTRRRTER